MKHIKTLTTRDYKESMKKGGCGECQTSCQSACKTSCTVGNQSCENTTKQQVSGGWHITIKEFDKAAIVTGRCFISVLQKDILNNRNEKKERLKIDTSI